MLNADRLRELAALGLTGEQLSGVLRVMADMLEAEASRRKADAERKARQRAKADPNLSLGQSRDSHGDPLSSPEQMSPTPPKTQPPSIPSKNTPKGVQKGSPKTRLEPVLTADMAEALVAHRKALKAPLTDKAAELLAKRLAGFPDPNAAAGLMIEKGWQSIEPSWVEGKNLLPATGPPNGSAQPPRKWLTEEEVRAELIRTGTMAAE